MLDSDPSHNMSDSSMNTNVGVNDSQSRQYKHLSRWDTISVGAFRQTRETGASSDAGWGSDSATDSVVKSPLKTMVWQSKSMRRHGGIGTAGSPAAAFPLAESSRSVSRTPSSMPPPEQSPKQKHKQTRRELRKERKLKKKNFGSMHPSHQHHQHKHHSNSKSRATASTQRTNFFASPSSSSNAN